MKNRGPVFNANIQGIQCKRSHLGLCALPIITLLLSADVVHAHYSQSGCTASHEPDPGVTWPLALPYVSLSSHLGQRTHPKQIKGGLNSGNTKGILSDSPLSCSCPRQGGYKRLLRTWTVYKKWMQLSVALGEIRGKGWNSSTGFVCNWKYANESMALWCQKLV